ncbi:MAG TPA: cysteine--tRNA ligase [Elusimicrobia bacterium]|nr:MAG: cysteine--tRNA ligase [Elusimicrobia bacterium RIFOXYA12_FULL_49_49]OGS09493.1 MAG: cysteine--tRNA ligase [Elusimicrobia bacterium RIFOXYA1_FULL_47_7]OGS10628.1 MAG: cysteine--tRNA ligase [Elusimicrobia bacterium RIFOXYB1_FULL_48_9]OGS15863.1 MAG: cysteine--tRNA ligase [Elusimicrobia bacterium RIFOXYA2_FULL_47_53]OGS27157.1 MAG: cysteine--tRNA ligase [Elusimicrobia bacterium RIFOXYB12_FULL_50_12]OGS31196.1 MAG: cysteine--tRNA ligase [Elusimicrobia bacterium RIFOXYB2_FULL_46_23]HBU7013
MRFYSTLTNKKEEFVPSNGKNVSMYVCGITPYDEVHLGHARAYVTFDTVRRHLEHSGYSVKFIQNFTDVDDKIIKRSIEAQTTPGLLSQKFITDYFTQMDKLNIKRAHAYPKVTENIPQIVAFIERLVGGGYAYELQGDIYFSVRKFADYGKLSKRSVEDLLSGARVEVDAQKKDPLDFALWKKTKPGEPEETSWKSPWGMGRPGWHIECSVMSTQALGDTIDIHGGGQDLIFPHHENEIAQSEAATGKPFARYWIHNGFVTINKEKMSKSLGNFFTLREIFEKYEPRVVRYFLLSQHYRSPLDFSDDKLKQSQKALNGIDTALDRLAQAVIPEPKPGLLENIGADTLDDYVSRFTAALDDDFSTEKAIAALNELSNEALSNTHSSDTEWIRKAANTMKLMLGDYLGIGPREKSGDSRFHQLVTERKEARAQKNWKRADEIRKEIENAGFKLLDNPDGTTTLTKMI